MSSRKKSWTKSMFNQLPETTDTPKKSSIKDKTLIVDLTSEDTEPLEPLKKPKTKNATRDNLPNWEVEFAPKIPEELAVHPKKIIELQNWMQHCSTLRRRYPAQLCLITGPAGVGKTAAVRVLAAQNQYQLQEWVNPVDCEVITQLGDQSQDSTYVVSQIQSFKSFLLRASRYKSLLEQKAKRLLLVEDFPNALLKDAAAFEGILEQYLQYGKSPLVFVVADSKSRGLNISYNLFSEEVKSKYKISHFSFNPIATTLMQKAMKRFCAILQQKESSDDYKVPAQNIIDSIVLSAQGDIRNGLLNFHFAALKAAPNLDTIPIEVEQSQSNHRRKRQRTLKSVGRNESITLLHAVGRILNPKYSNSNSKKSEERKLIHSPEDLSEAFSTEPKRCIDFAHANYLAHFSDIAHVVAAADDLTRADTMLQEYKDDALALCGLNLAMRSIMVANETPATGWLPVRGPKRLCTSQKHHEFIGEHYIPLHLYATEFSTYIKCIDPKATVPSADNIDSY